VRVPAGAFELEFPAAGFGDAEGVERLQRVTLALLDAQRRWVDWVEPTGEAAGELRAALDALREQADEWDGRQLARLAGESGDLLELLGGGEELRAAVELTREELPRLVPGAARSSRLPVRMLLLPDRELFVQFLCYAGWSRPELRGSFWVEGIETWTNSFIDDLQVYAMEYAAPGGRWDEGMSMSHASETGLEEQMVQLAMGDLLERLYGGALPASFVGGVSTNLVIDLYGEVDTRVDGDLGGRTTSARETFVPGGQSYGGVLPKNRADSSWREHQGAGYFVGVLRASQKKGRKARRLDGTQSPNRDGTFVLEPVGGRERYAVGAPILGPAAGERSAPPSAFQGEYQEFLRAYRSAFLYWLQTEAAGKEDASRAAFAALLGELAGAASSDAMDAAFTRIYEAPLSNEEADKDCLEGQFLRWLSKQRAR
jgi:hypothetical protein